MDVRIPTLVPLDIDLERIAERAGRRFELAKAALTGLLCGRKFKGTDDAIVADVYASVACGLADALLAALDATAGPASASVPPAPVSRPPETGRTQRGGA